MSLSAVYLLRHGETEGGAGYWGRTDVALSVRGRQQMHDAVAALHADGIVTSPLQRCRAFAEELSGCRGLPLTIDPRLQEMDFGRWDGRTAADIMTDDPNALEKFWRDPALHPPPGGETVQALIARVAAAIRDVLGRSEDRNVLVVSHGGPIRTILCLVQGHPIEALLDIDMPHASVHRVNACQIRRFAGAAVP